MDGEPVENDEPTVRANVRQRRRWPPLHHSPPSQGVLRSPRLGVGSVGFLVGDFSRVEELERKFAQMQQDLVACRSDLGNEIQQLKEQITQMRSLVPDPSPPGQPDKEQTNDIEITPVRLDAGHSYAANESVWDACLFLGHRGVGPGNSFVLFLLWAVNAFIQVFFVITLAFFVPIEGVHEGVLDDLLRFRVGVAHSASEADSVTQSSMIADICSVNEKLHVSGGQLSILQDVRRFKNGGPALMYLSQCLWLFLIMQELESVWQFTRVLLAIEKDRWDTKIIIADSTRDSFDKNTYTTWKRHVRHREHDVEATRSTRKEAVLSTLMVAVRVEFISYTRALCALVFIVVPRVVISCSLGYTGMIFLGATTTHADLILNCLAFAFVCDVDELIFGCFAPFRVRTLMHNLEPIPTPRAASWLGSSAASRMRDYIGGSDVVQQIVKMGFVAAALLTLCHFELWPRFWLMNQVDIVLCGGDVDFIYSKNAANDILYVTKSSNDDEWQEDEKVILQVAGIPLENDYWPTLEDEIMERAYSSTMFAVPLPSTGLVDGGYTASSFSTVMQLEVQSLEEAAEQLGCRDLGTSATVNTSLHALHLLSGNTSHTDCSDIPWQWCSGAGYSQLRALCPIRCNCHYPVRYLRGYSGYFQSPAGGCPGQCKSLVASFNEIFHAKNPVVESMGYIPCRDVDADTLVFQSACVDTDRFTNAFDIGGYTCETYSDVLLLWYYDDENGFLNSSFCGGAWDDNDFSASTMCCVCRGGSTNVSTSAACAANLTDDCENMNLEAFSLMAFIRGVFEVLLATPGFEDAVTQIVQHPSNIITVSEENKTALIEWVISGQMPQSILSGDWEFLPGVPHPRGLTGCEYLTSFEITALLNIDLCSSETYLSLKSLCPISCGCSLGSFYYDNGTGAATEFFESVGFPNVSAFTRKPEDMAHCPASCVVPHPTYTGDSSLSDWDYYQYYYR